MINIFFYFEMILCIGNIACFFYGFNIINLLTAWLCFGIGLQSKLDTSFIDLSSKLKELIMCMVCPFTMIRLYKRIQERKRKLALIIKILDGQVLINLKGITIFTADGQLSILLNMISIMEMTSNPAPTAIIMALNSMEPICGRD